MYDFQSASEKEVSFKKGDIIVLTEQVDANWLKGTVNGSTGIFPVTFVKVCVQCTVYMYVCMHLFIISIASMLMTNYMYVYINKI